MPNPARQKGNRIEREIVQLHQAVGVDAVRVPLSGQCGGQFKGDLRIAGPKGELTGEVKARASGEGFVTLERWLGEMDLLFLRRDRAAPLVVMPWHVYAALLGKQT